MEYDLGHFSTALQVIVKTCPLSSRLSMAVSQQDILAFPQTLT